MCNQNQINDVTKLGFEDILMIISLCFYFCAIIVGVLGTKENVLKKFT